MPARRRRPASSGSVRLAAALLAATVPLLAAWALTAGSGDLASQAIAASSGALVASAGQADHLPARMDTATEAAWTRARTRAGTTPRQAKAERKRRARAASQRSVLSHPLVGRKLAVVKRQLGPPSAERSEAAAGVIFLEYHLPNERYQLLVNDGRVIEVNRYR